GSRALAPVQPGARAGAELGQAGRPGPGNRLGARPGKGAKARAGVIKDGQEVAQAAAGIGPDVRLARPSVQRTADLLGAGDLWRSTPPGPAHRRAKLGSPGRAAPHSR